MIHDQPDEHERGGGEPKLRDGSFDQCFLETQHAERICEGSMQAGLPLVLGTPGTPPDLHQSVGPRRIGQHVRAKASSIIHRFFHQ